MKYREILDDFHKVIISGRPAWSFFWRDTLLDWERQIEHNVCLKSVLSSYQRYLSGRNFETPGAGGTTRKSMGSYRGNGSIEGEANALHNYAGTQRDWGMEEVLEDSGKSIFESWNLLFQLSQNAVAIEGYLDGTQENEEVDKQEVVPPKPKRGRAKKTKEVVKEDEGEVFVKVEGEGEVLAKEELDGEGKHWVVNCCCWGINIFWGSLGPMFLRSKSLFRCILSTICCNRPFTISFIH